MGVNDIVFFKEVFKRSNIDKFGFNQIFSFLDVKQIFENVFKKSHVDSLCPHKRKCENIKLCVNVS